LIHSYDYPPLAEVGLPAARRYSQIAASTPHAQHMPSHIFTRLGYWPESIASNTASIAAGQLDFVDRLHAMDYMTYAYLQSGQDREASRILEAIRKLTKIEVERFPVAFALAAIPVRYALEHGHWKDAAAIALHPGEFDFPWASFPNAEAINAFGRGLGAARAGDAGTAKQEIARLESLRQAMQAANQPYWASQAAIQGEIVAAWVANAEGRSDEALRLMRRAADAEDATEKNVVTPGPLLPARELLGDLLLERKLPAEALVAYESALAKEPGRFRALYGAARAAELAGDTAKARGYYSRLAELAAGSDRTEVKRAKAYLAQN
jgi:tetratricopeptide (TPR) repeat protein